MTVSPSLPLAGIALIPDNGTRALLSSFSEFAAEVCDPDLHPGVDLRVHVPHLTLWQSPTLPGAAEAVTHLDLDPTPTTLGELYVTDPGWLFARCPVPATLHHRSRRAISTHVDLVHLPDPGPGLTPEELATYYAHGYRYADDGFDPHITVGRATRVPDMLATWWVNNALGYPVSWSRVVFAEVNPDHGTLRQVVNDTPFPD